MSGRLRGIAFAAIAAIACIAARAQVPPPPQVQPLVITGATLHTVSGPVIENGRMLVEGGRITAVAAPGEPLPAPLRGAAPVVVDLAGKHVFPGFVAANTALGLTEIAAVRATVDLAEYGPLNPANRALASINADSDLLPVARANGVLAALVVPQVQGGGVIAGRSTLVQLDGWNWDEMAIEPEVGLHVVLPSLRLGREGLAALFEPLSERAQDELRKFTAERLRMLDEAFEAALAYRGARAASPDTPADQRWEAMAPYATGTKPVFVHADELPQIRHALSLGERFGLKLVIVGGADAWRIADVLRERRVPVVIGGTHAVPLRRDDDIDARDRLAARLAAAGVTFAIARVGGPYAAANERNLPYEAARAAAHGLPRDEALRAITLYPARILGVADRLGSLEPGRIASFVVTDGDPLEVTTKVERVFIAGREVDAGNRQTRLVDKYEQRTQQIAPQR